VPTPALRCWICDSTIASGSLCEDCRSRAIALSAKRRMSLWTAIETLKAEHEHAKHTATK
jgi:hypothetical protein